MKKRLFTMALTLLSIIGTWAYDFKVDGLCYNFHYNSNNEVYVTYEQEPNIWGNIPAYTSLSGDITIPSSVSYEGQNYSVTSIGNRAFADCRLTTVTIPNSVTSIRNEAFHGCKALWSVTIPNSVTSIGSDAFHYCSALTSVTIPNSVTSIGSRAFYSCYALSHIRCDATTPPTLDSYVFDQTDLQLVFVPAGTATAYANAWGNNYTYIDSETEVTVHVETADQLTAAIVAQGATPASVTKLTVTGILSEASFNTIKSNMPRLHYLDLSGISNTTLPEEALSQKQSLLSVVLPNGLTEIPYMAFAGCRLTTVTIPNSVTSIGEGAFSGCTSLGFVTIPNSVTNIGESAFSGTSLGFVTIPNSVTSIGESAFHGCKALWSVTIPNSVTSIGEHAFYHCSALTSVTIGNSVTSIGGWTFSYCTSLTSVTIGNSVTSIGSDAFVNCTALSSVYYTGSVADWCQIKFDNHSSNPLSNGVNFYINNTLITTDLAIPDEITEIKDYAFYGCSDLISVTIPNSVTSIGNYAFDGCSVLRSITSYATIPPMIAAATFSEVNKSIPINVPKESLNVYSTGKYWEEFNNYQGLANSNQLIVIQNEGGCLWYNNSIVTSGSILEISNDSNILLQIIPDEGYGISSITCGGTDYTDDINPNGYLTLPSISSTTILQVTFERLEIHTISYYAEGSSIIFKNEVNNGENFTFYITTQNGRTIASVSLNGEDITEQLDADGNINLYDIQQNMVIVVSTAAAPSEISSTEPSRLRAWQADGTLFVEMDDAVESVMVYDETGRLMQEYQHNGGYQMLNLPAPNKVNLVKVVCKDGSVSTHKLM